MSVAERRFQLLMSEKEFADSQIGGFFDLQVKVLTFLGAAVILLGWLYSEKPLVNPNDKAVSTYTVRLPTGPSSNMTLLEIVQQPSSESMAYRNTTIVVLLLALVIVGCSVTLQSITMYGTSLAYLEYKMTTLNDKFRAALTLPEPPFSSLGVWRSSPTKPPVMLAAVGLFAMHVIVDIILLCIAWRKASEAELCVAVFAAGGYEVLTIVAEFQVMYALSKLMRQAPTAKSLA